MSKPSNPYSNYYPDYDTQSNDVEAYLTTQQEISRRIAQLAGIPQDRLYTQQQQLNRDAQDRHAYEEYLETQQNRYDRNINQEITSQLESFRELLKKKQKKHPTYNDLITKNILSLSDVQRLTDALSLCISNKEERESFDTIVKNWIDDQLKKLEKEY